MTEAELREAIETATRRALVAAQIDDDMPVARLNIAERDRLREQLRLMREDRDGR